MIIITKQGQRENIPYLTAYSLGVFIFQFYGNATYTDPYDGTIWNWENINNTLEEILAVTIGAVQLTVTTSLNDCVSLESSFYWDDDNGALYVHWPNSSNDYPVNREQSSYSAITPGAASGIHRATGNYFDGVFYNPTITGISGISKTVDPTKLGLVAFKSSSMDTTNQAGEDDQLTGYETVGVPIWFYRVEEGDTELTNDMRIFTGYANGYRNNRDKLSRDIIETRLFENKPSCPNVVSTDDYPNAGDQAGKIIPTAWGDIYRGIMVLVNADSLTDAGTQTAIYLVADPSLFAVRAISNVYDNSGVAQSGLSVNLTACTVSFSKTAGVSVSDMKKFTWEGQGYNIPGTYNNGLDIIKAAFSLLSNVPYLESTFNTTEWAAATVANTADITLSVQSDKGFIENIVQPIMTSIQGVLEILGDGRITWKDRDTTAALSATILKTSQTKEPSIEEDPKNTVSDLIIEYKPDYKNKEYQSYKYSVYSGEVKANYGIDRQDPLSPVKTALFNQSDVINLAAEIMDTSKAPERIITVEEKDLVSVRIFDMIAVDTGKYPVENLEYGEILGINPDYIGKKQNITIRVIPDYTP